MAYNVGQRGEYMYRELKYEELKNHLVREAAIKLSRKYAKCVLDTSSKYRLQLGYFKSTSNETCSNKFDAIDDSLLFQF